MIKILAQVQTNSYDYSVKDTIIEYDNIEDFKKEALKYFPKINVSLPRDNGELWFGLQYGDTADGFKFRWLKAIIDTERGCLYSYGDYSCVENLALPHKKQHCSKEVEKLLTEIREEVEKRKAEITFVP